VKWSYEQKWTIIAAMPVMAFGCTILAAVLIKIKNVAREAYQMARGVELSPPTEIDALYGLLFSSFYYLYLQVPCCRALRDVCVSSSVSC
jgi:hypothetical protein